jgi:hypothetical protein
LMGCIFSAISARPSAVDEVRDTITAKAIIASIACISSTPFRTRNRLADLAAMAS